MSKDRGFRATNLVNKKWPHFLNFLNDELDFRVRSSKTTLDYETFRVDFSSYKLRLSTLTPVIWVKSSDLDEIDSSLHLFQSLQDVTREREYDRQTIALVLMDGDSKSLRKHTDSPLYNMVVIGSGEQEQIVDSRRPSYELLDIISAQIPISTLAPYEVAAPVTGSRFFGRDWEIRRIMGNMDTNHVILGIRRIGKTSLVLEIKRRLAESVNPPKVIYLDCSDQLESTADYVREVVRELNPKELPRIHLQKYAFFFPDFLDRMRRMYKSKIIFVLDEIDFLINLERGNYDLFRMFRASANKGACQYIMAGYRDAMEEVALDDSPLYRFGQETWVKEFQKKDAQDLITVPMKNLGVRFNNENEVVGRIYEETAGHPNLIQRYCDILLKRLDQMGEREISPDSLLDIYTDETFKSTLLYAFMKNTDNREKALIFAVLDSFKETKLMSFSQDYMDDALKAQGIELLHSDIDDACNVLVMAGFLYQKNQDFSFTAPVFADMLQHSYNIPYLLNKIKEEGI